MRLRILRTRYQNNLKTETHHIGPIEGEIKMKDISDSKRKPGETADNHLHRILHTAPHMARTTKKSMTVIAGRSSGNLWKTRKTRNIAGFPVSRHILGIGWWSRSETCRARLTPVVCPLNNTAEGRATWPRPKVAGASFLQQGYGK
jgi:hypothetical protein